MWNGWERESRGVTERRFTLPGGPVPGVLWTPTDATGPRPLVLMGHGNSQHKRVDTILARARRFVRQLGVAVAAIDAPGHGDRVSPAEAAERVAALRARIAARRRPDAALIEETVARATQAGPEWTVTLEALLALDVIGDDAPVGYWGVSMGATIGIPFVAQEPRIRAAVFGLTGVLAGDDWLTRAAARVTVPVEFALQSDDEIVDRAAGLALFDAFGSAEKTLHLNPGGHLDLPAFEATSWQAFFARHLLAT